MRNIPQHIWDVWNAGGAIVGANKAPHGRVTVETDWHLTAQYDDVITWTQYDYQDDLWTDVNTIITVEGAQLFWGPPAWDGAFPDPTAEVCWTTGGTIHDASNAEVMYARWKFTSPLSGSGTLDFTVDNEADVWFDDVFLGTHGSLPTDTSGFTTTASYSLSLTPGNHVVCVKATNGVQSQGNPAGVAWACYAGSTLIAHSDSSGKMQEALTRDPEVQYRIGDYYRAPVRWWQNSANDQVETEVPNIETIQIDRSVDQDAATCKITLSNQWHLNNGDVESGDPELGQPGYFTFSRGDSADALSRWGHVPNDWNNVLIPDALIRTYQGYGGKTKSIQDAEDDGNIVLTGVWLVDSVRVGTSGKVELSCRDMAKLLIEQQLYPPLVPSNIYPLTYSRWGFDNLGSDQTLLSVGTTAQVDLTSAGPYAWGGATNYDGPVWQPDFPDYEGNEPGNGYWILVNDGHVYAFGNNIHYGEGLTDPSVSPAVGLVEWVGGRGYYVVYRDGTVANFGDAVACGSTPRPNVTGLARTSRGAGYWIIDAWGTVTNHGSAVHHGNCPTAPDFADLYASDFAVDIVGDPIGDGYWCLTNKGHVYAFGSATDYGEPFNGVVGTFQSIRPHPYGNGYWVIDQIGNVYAYGDAKFYGQLAGQAYEALGGNLPFDNPDFPDYMSALIPTPSGNGYWLLGVSGGVYPFGDAIFLGALNAPYEAQLRINGNYTDYSDIIKDLALWAGFWLYPEVETVTTHDDETGLYSTSTTPSVYGNIETTGAFASDRLNEEMFDKKPVIDPMTKLKEIVGYQIWVDDEGAFRFESPNIYSPGNFDEDGVHTDTIPEIDERIQLTDYTVEYADKSTRSEIIISTTDPTAALDDTITTRFTPQTAEILRGMIKPAMWVNGVFTIKREQQLMAELIALYIWLAQRQGSVTCLANPAIQINDQVKIWERVTGETYIHYVRGISTTMDLIQGTYMSSLTTHWMGDDTLWAVDLATDPFEFSGITTERALTYNRSTSDGHGTDPPTITYDGNLATAWRPPITNGQLYNDAIEFIEYDLTGTINRVGIYAFGVTDVYVSVMVGGVWQGGGTVPYNPATPAQFTGADNLDPEIAYVYHSSAVPDEAPMVITLPSTYNATKVRITLSGFSPSTYGPFYYYGGLREIAVGLT